MGKDNKDGIESIENARRQAEQQQKTKTTQQEKPLVTITLKPSNQKKLIKVESELEKEVRKKQKLEEEKKQIELDLKKLTERENKLKEELRKKEVDSTSLKKKSRIDALEIDLGVLEKNKQSKQKELKEKLESIKSSEIEIKSKKRESVSLYKKVEDEKKQESPFQKILDDFLEGQQKMLQEAKAEEERKIAEQAKAEAENARIREGKRRKDLTENESSRVERAKKTVEEGRLKAAEAAKIAEAKAVLKKLAKEAEAVVAAKAEEAKKQNTKNEVEKVQKKNDERNKKKAEAAEKVKSVSSHKDKKMKIQTLLSEDGLTQVNLDAVRYILNNNIGKGEVGIRNARILANRIFGVSGNNITEMAEGQLKKDAIKLLNEMLGKMSDREKNHSSLYGGGLRKEDAHGRYDVPGVGLAEHYEKLIGKSNLEVTDKLGLYNNAHINKGGIQEKRGYKDVFKDLGNNIVSKISSSFSKRIKEERIDASKEGKSK